MRLTSVTIQGYRPFRDFEAKLQPLEVMVGANGSGKSSFFEFLKFFRDKLYYDIPPGTIPISGDQQLFHIPKSTKNQSREQEKIQWEIEIDKGSLNTLIYSGQILGPMEDPTLNFEYVRSSNESDDYNENNVIYLENIRGEVNILNGQYFNQFELEIPINNQCLMLRTMSKNPEAKELYNLAEYIRQWKFFNVFKIINYKIRNPVMLEEKPTLYEDGGNLSSVLHYLMTEDKSAFDKLQQHLRSVVPGFQGLTVKARGGSGKVLGFWQESGIEQELSFNDLSDGILHLIYWFCLCLQPNLPSLICIDQPEQGVHPRTLPVLAGLFEKAAERTQVFLATHSSYLLTQFDISQIAVFRKENGEAKFIKPGDSQVLRDILDDFGADEIEKLHRSDELERLP